MDVYHKILSRIYKETGGKPTEYVDLREIVKDEGFTPSYSDIHKQLNRAGWISDTGSGSNVKITHWGIKEAKKSDSGGGSNAAEVAKSARRVLEAVKELHIMAEELVGEPAEGKIKQVEKRLAEVGKTLEDLKSIV